MAALRAARRTGRPALIKKARAAVIAHCHGLLRRHRLFRFVLLRGVVGQFTFRTKQGTLRTLAFERGVIKSVSGNAIVVRTVNGITETWQLVGNTVVREHGKKTSAQRADQRRAGVGRRPGDLRGQGRPAHRDPATPSGTQDRHASAVSIRQLTGADYRLPQARHLREPVAYAGPPAARAAPR